MDNPKLEILFLFHSLLIHAKAEHLLPHWLKKFSLDNDNKDGEIIFTLLDNKEEIVVSSNNFTELEG